MKAKAITREVSTNLEGLGENTTIYSYTGLSLSALPEVDEREPSLQEVEGCRQKTFPIPSGAREGLAHLFN